MKLSAVSVKDRPDLFPAADAIACSAWPEFLLHVNIANLHFGEFVQTFPDHQFILLTEAQEIAGVINSVPIHLAGGPASLGDEGWDWAILKSLAEHQQGVLADTLVGLQVVIAPHLQGQGLSAQAVALMRDFRKRQAYRQLIIPVRPTAKHLYPLIPMAEYLHWCNPEGLAFDPWLRVHQRLGGHILRACEHSMRVEAPISDWEIWTGLKIPGSGAHIIPKALNPVQMDKATNTGLYMEANVWMLHD